MKLGELQKGDRALIVAVECGTEEYLISQRLMEMGLLEGSTVEVVHEAPFSRDPLAIRIRGALIAIRRSEANLIEVVKK